MAPIKFEGHIKSKLEERKLSTSTDAWEVLQKRLDDNKQVNKSNKGFWWFGIAASLVGVLVMINVLTKNDNTNVEPTLVETDSVKQINEEQTLESKVVVHDDMEDKVEQPKNIQEQSVIVAQDSNEPKQDEKAIVINKLPEVNEKKIQKSEVAEALNPEELEPVKTVSLEDQKVKDVVDRILKLQKGDAVVTDAQIDSMLNAAQNELKIQKAYNESTKKVDAMALLQDVEFELEKSFRDKVFEALGSSFKSVKTAVAERNN